MAGLKEPRRASKQAAVTYAGEIADLLVRYEAAALTNWRDQDQIWKEIRKRLAQYKVAKAREEKEQREQLWATERQRKIDSAKQRAERQKNEKRSRQASSE